MRQRRWLSSLATVIAATRVASIVDDSWQFRFVVIRMDYIIQHTDFGNTSFGILYRYTACTISSKIQVLRS